MKGKKAPDASAPVGICSRSNPGLTHTYYNVPHEGREKSQTSGVEKREDRATSVVGLGGDQKIFCSNDFL